MFFPGFTKTPEGDDEVLAANHLRVSVTRQSTMMPVELWMVIDWPLSS